MAMKEEQGNVARLQDAGLIPRDHKLSYEDQQTLNKLSPEEIDVLKTVRGKLGDDFLRKTAEGKIFPHPMSLSF